MLNLILDVCVLVRVSDFDYISNRCKCFCLNSGIFSTYVSLDDNLEIVFFGLVLGPKYLLKYCLARPHSSQEIQILLIKLETLDLWEENFPSDSVGFLLLLVMERDGCLILNSEHERTQFMLDELVQFVYLVAFADKALVWGFKFNFYLFAQH